MKYLHEIIWYLSWALLIFISYQSIKWMLKKFEKIQANTVKEEENFDI